MPDSNCPFCDTSIYKFALQCDTCHYWVYYSCTNLPPYAIIQLRKSARLFSCLTCVHERLKNDFPELHTEIEGAIKSQNDAIPLPVMSEISLTPIEAASPPPQPHHPFQQLQHPLMQPQFPPPLRKHYLLLPPFLSHVVVYPFP